MVTTIIVDNTIVTEAGENYMVPVILDKSHFYSQSGGTDRRQRHNQN